MFVDFSDEWNNTAVPKSLLEVINIQFASRAFAFTLQTSDAMIDTLCGGKPGRAERAARARCETGQKGSASDLPRLLPPFPRKTRPWKSQGLCCLLQPITALKVVQIMFPLLTISDWERIFLGAFLTFGIFSCSLAIVFASSLFSYRESWNGSQLKSFFNSFLLLLWQNKFWTVGMIQCHLLLPQIVFPFYQEILLNLDLIICLCEEGEL